MVSVDKTVQIALENIYNNIHKIKYDGVYYRRDIGCNNKLQKHIPISIGILASGNGTSVEKLIEERYKDIKIIITNRTTAGILSKAQKYNLPFFCFPSSPLYKCNSKNDYYEKIVNILRQFNIDIVILSGYMEIVPEILFEDFYTINIHPSLLPKYKGYKDLDAHKAVLLNNERFTGCTLHIVTKKIDSGRILLQKQCPVLTNNAKILKKTVQELEKDCIVEYIDRYTNDNIKTHYDVDIEKGNLFIEELKKKNKYIGGFCAEYKHKNIRLATTADGCGTKIDLANKYNTLDTIGIDLVAMNVNDLLAGGAKPLFFMDYIAIDKMDNEKCNKIIKGINKGCEMANCVLIGGETAEMKGIYLKNKLDLGGFSVGEIIYDLPKKKLMTDECILYGIPSSGIHSNGYTLVRKLLETRAQRKSDLNILQIDTILQPTRIYTELLDLYEEYPNNILGVAHITGGGFHDNLIRILPKNLYFELEEWEFPSIFKWIQKTSGLNRQEMLNIFNCGYGMVIVSNTKLPLAKIGRLINV
jgi:phosphoribosylaminoimidazole synthetase